MNQTVIRGLTNLDGQLQYDLEAGLEYDLEVFTLSDPTHIQSRTIKPGYSMDPTESETERRNEAYVASKIFVRYLRPMQTIQQAIRTLRETGQPEAVDPQVQFLMHHLNHRLAEGLLDTMGWSETIPVLEEMGYPSLRCVWRNGGDIGADRWGSMRRERILITFGKIIGAAHEKAWERNEQPEEPEEQ